VNALVARPTQWNQVVYVIVFAVTVHVVDFNPLF